LTSPDHVLSEWITGAVGEVHFFDNVMTLLASDFFIPVSMSLYILYLWFGTRDPVLRVKTHYGAMCASASLGFGCLGVHILNRGFGYDPWPRPFVVHDAARSAAETILYLPSDPSFPANVAAASFGAAMGMWFYRRKASIPLFIFAVLWSFGRVYAGVHYPLDILGGAAIGVIAACFTYGLMILLWPVPKFFYWLAQKIYLA
jgi:undecaprenyl-diphosphatase